MKEALREGDYGVIYKPYSIEEILDITRSILKTNTVLVVDDMEAHRAILCSILENTGYAVDTADNGHKALEMIKADNFDLVLLDMMLPQMNGLQVLQQLKGNDELRHIPVIVTMLISSS